MKILVLAVFGIGNTINKTPMIQALRRLHPDARIDMVCQDKGVDVVKGWRELGSVWYYDDAGEIKEKPGYDYYVVARPANGWLAHVVPPDGKLVGDWGDTECWTQHEIEWNMELAYRMGYEGPVPDPHFEIGPGHVSLPGPRDRELIGVHVDCLPGWEWKHWPLEHWSELIRMFDPEKYQFVLQGGPTGRDDAKELMRGLGQYAHDAGVINMAGGLALKWSGWLLKQFRLFITVDSGPSHMASALRVPTITLFGPTSVIKNRPWFGRVVQVDSGFDLQCMPCQEKPGGMDMMKQCQHRACLTALTPQQVYGEAMEVLGGLE